MTGMEPMAPAFGALGIIFAIIWFSIIIGFLVGSLLTLIAIWRAAKAHKSLAKSVAELVEVMKEKK